MPSSPAAAPSSPERPTRRERSTHKSSSSNLSDATSYGQVIEYIEGRLYLASYTHTPTDRTPFPYPPKNDHSSQKRTSKHPSNPAVDGSRSKPPLYFCADNALLYNAFHADFGPLHVGHLYHFAMYIHDLLSDPEALDRQLVFWTKPDSRSRANAACLLACYMILLQSWPPHLALAPIAQMDPPPMPFRDAGYSQADYTITIQDVVYGVWRAKEEGLLDLHNFNCEEYERYERVENGDFNWISPQFVAFASPQHKPVDILPPSDPAFQNLPSSTIAVYQSTNLPDPFKHVLGHFKTRKVGLVVRLNNELYSPSYFNALGIRHIDMIFDDGTCPPLALVKKFIRMSHEMITLKRRRIAVHCKAGLGRTGCLIGAYLIYRHGFTAAEVIAYMRFMRPGMVVGPQQHWLHLNQNKFREWWYEDSIQDKITLLQQQGAISQRSPNSKSTPPASSKHGHQRLASNGQTFTPPNGSLKRHALGEVDYNEKSAIATEENLPAPTPGQPRKMSKSLGGERIYNANTTSEHPSDTENRDPSVPLRKEDEYLSTTPTREGAGSESEEEAQLRLLAKRQSLASLHRSPSTAHATPGAHSTTTPATKKYRSMASLTAASTAAAAAATKEFEQNHQQQTNDIPPLAIAKTPSHNSSIHGRRGNGAGAIAVAKRGSPIRITTEGSIGLHGSGFRSNSGIRKTSSGSPIRIGSTGAVRVKQ